MLTEAVDGSVLLGGVLLACPKDRGVLRSDAKGLACSQGHVYPVVDGVPVLLRVDVPDTHPYFEASRRAASEPPQTTPDGEPTGGETVDRFVQEEIVKTNGILYRGTLNSLKRYPIPEIPLPPGIPGSARLLDIGCNWGRWTIAASRRGYQAIGIDPGLEAVRAAYRVSRQLGQSAEFVVGDGRSLPFPNGAFDVVFSYSVLQHFSKEDARASIREAARVTRAGGKVVIQLANLLGARQLYNQLRDVIRREQNVFRVRRWTPSEMLAVFEELVGPAQLSADGFFSLNAQPTDVDILAPFPRAVVRTSSALKKLSTKVSPLALLADSVFITASRAA